MSPKGRKPGRKSKLSVQFKPLEGQAFFDIRRPENSSGKIEDARAGEREESRKGFGYFFMVALVIFGIFSALGIGMNGVGLFQEAKPLAYAGYDNLVEGVGALKNQDFDAARQWFAKAEDSFDALSDNLRALTGQANQYLDSPLYLDAANKLIQSGVTGSQIGQELTSILVEAKRVPAVFTEQNLKGNSSVKLTDVVRDLQKRVESLNQKTLLLQSNLATLNAGTLPAQIRTQIERAQQTIGLFAQGLAEIRGEADTALKLLGDHSLFRYLVLFQNNHELRATGGFIGSYMLVDVMDGAISKIETKDVYETDGNLVDKVPPPPGIDQVTDRWYMRDANYSPDFPTSAEKIMWFLEHSRGPSVDAVIAIDQTVAEKLLDLTGPVQLKSFPFTIRADNFNELFSFHIESKLSDTSTPKQLLIDFVPILKEKLVSLQDFSRLGDALSGLVAGRHIQVYSQDPDIEALAEKLNLDGKMVAPSPKTDFLALVTTSIGGNKSDAFIKTTIDHHTAVGQSGLVTDHLVITKNHTWTEQDFAPWQKLIDQYGTGKLDVNTLRFIQGEGDNMDYLRVYVPLGSRLKGMEGADPQKVSTSEDLGYTVFAFPFGPVSPGHERTVSLDYELPFALSAQSGDIYRFIGQKQAGSDNVTLKKSLAVSDALKVVQTYPKIDAGPFTLYPEYETPLDGNKIFLSAIASNIQ
jgi:Protein of unknown function (DUF4012)